MTTERVNDPRHLCWAVLKLYRLGVELDVIAAKCGIGVDEVRELIVTALRSRTLATKEDES